MQHQNLHRRRPTRKPPPLIEVQPDQVAFRVVCHVSIISGLIGPSGTIISQIRRDTSCVVHCDELVQGSDHRVVLVIGSKSPGRTIGLKSGDGDDDAEGEKVVSGPQEAVLRVLERMWEIDAETGGVAEDENGVREGYCGLLVNTTQVGAVVGRGGKNITRMRRETGAQIRILPAPRCAAKDDELIQITGELLAVKKAVFAVTGVLQDCPPYEKDVIPLTRSDERASHGASPSSSDPHAEFFPHLYSFLPTLTENHTNACSSPTDADRDVDPETKTNQQEVSFRLLCSNGAAGCIIGKRGAIVRALQNETGASILFAAPLTKSDERVVTISASERLESWHSPAQNAAVLVFARSVEYDIEKGRMSGLIKGSDVTARLLVASDVVCCLSGSGDGIDSEMKKATGADIQILERDPALDFALGNDVVVQITGEYKNVQNALFQVTGKLRNNLLPSEVVDEVRAKSSYGTAKEITSPRLHQSTGLSLDSHRETSLTRGMGQLGLSDSIGDPSSPGLPLRQNLARGCTTGIADDESNSTTFGRGSELERSLHFLLPREVLHEVGARGPDRGVRETTCPGLQSSFKTTRPGFHSLLSPSPDSVPETILTRGNSNLKLSNNTGGPSAGLQLPQNVGRGYAIAIADNEIGSPTFGGSVELGRKSPAIMENTTVELIVSEDFLGSVYGEDGNTLAHLRQISGANIEVRDPSPGKSDAVVVISGTPDETMAAQSLLQAFILTGQ